MTVRVYPLVGHYLSDVPHSVHTVSSKAVAKDLIASGAFTDNPNDAERDMEAPDLGPEPVTHARTRFQGEEPSAEIPEAPAPKTEE